MKTAALISGGKDSTYNMMQCIASGHEIVALANLTPQSLVEIDSYMYQSVGHEAIQLIAQAMDLPLYRVSTTGYSSQRGKIYEPQDDSDEVEDLYNLLNQVKNEMDIEAVSVGAILSDYQRVRVENVCVRLGLVPLSYLWQRDQGELLNEIIKCEVDAIIIKVAALGLDPQKHLGRTLSSIQSHLTSMHEKYGLNVCGEGGEYETLTLDCPLFTSRIIIEDSEVIIHSNDQIAPVAYLKLNKLSLEPKLPPLDLQERLSNLPLKGSNAYISNGSDDDNADEALNQMNILSVTKSKPEQKPNVQNSSNGWLWIGGIQGSNSEPHLAAEEALSSLKSILENFGHGLQDVCSLTMFISDMGKFGEINRIYCEWFRFPNPPTRACVEVPLDEECVIICALSWRLPDGNSGDSVIERHTMHVQSRSHWAPSNIGPYSQAVRIGELIKLAGQIGLIPGNLQMTSGGVKRQCRLTLRHISRLLKAIDQNINLRDVVQGVCYVTDISQIESCRKMWEEKTNNAIVDYVVVSKLPRNALVEWHVWAHKHNNQFEYEETGKSVDSFAVSIFRRWNYENNIAAIVGHIENSNSEAQITPEIFLETIRYVLQKLQQGHENDTTSIFNIYIYYSVIKNTTSFPFDLSEITQDFNLVYTFVPVLYLKNENIFFSICGVRNQ